MPPSREVENDGRRAERHEHVELGSENDDPDALDRPLDRPSRVPGGRHGGPQPTVRHLRAVDLETAHLDLRSLHPLVWTQTLRRARAARDQEEEGCSGRRGSLGIIIANARPGSRDGSGGAPGEGQQLASACRVVAAPAAAGGARAGFQVERAGVAPLPGLSPAGCRCRRRARCCCWLFARSLQAHAARAHQISCVPASLLTGRGAGDLRVGGG